MPILNKDELKKAIRANNLYGVDDFKDLMGEITRNVVEVMLEGELTGFLGYEKHDHGGKEEAEYLGINNNNSRNGSSKKKVKSKYGELGLSIPRDRKGEFSPQLVQKGQNNIVGLEEKILSMYARGMSTRDISSHVEEIYGYKISAETVSNITDQIQIQQREWQSRPIEPIYMIVFLDCLFVKIRSESRVVRNMAIYNILGITIDGKKECLGFWISEDGESSSFWLGVLNELQNRGLKDVLIFSVDNLTGISEAISTVYPKAEIQKCIVHQIRNSNKYVNYKDRRELSGDLKSIYKASTEDQGLLALEGFDKKWGKKYPFAVASWKRNWTELSVFFKYPPVMRRLIYTTNPIESMNRGLRKTLKTKSSLPSQDSAQKLLYLSMKQMSEKWSRPLRNWGEIFPHLLIYFKERVEKYL